MWLAHQPLSKWQKLKATLFFRLGLPLQMIHRVKTKPTSQAIDDNQSDR